jgi:hypothetical protein
MNYDTFEKLGGYLQFLLEETHPSEIMDKWTEDEHEWSIMNCRYIYGSAASIIRQCGENRIAALVMDMTWSFMRLYLTAILDSVSRNTSTPLAFAFGPEETSALYAQLSTVFQTHYEMELGQFIAESNPGSALKSICRKYGNRHKASLQHFLAQLKHPYFSVYFADLV